MGEFDEFITGKLEMKVGGKDLKLDATIKDKRKLKSMYAGGSELTEEKLEKMDNCFIDILTRSYPDEKPEAMEGFYTKNDMEFMTEFFIAIGWSNREDAVKTKVNNPN